MRRLLTVLSRLVDQGNTVLVIEHNLDVIKTADWIVDLGPYGGSGGGTIVAEGSPEHVSTVEESFTGQFLGRVLSLTPGYAANDGSRAAQHQAAVAQGGESAVDGARRGGGRHARGCRATRPGGGRDGSTGRIARSGSFGVRERKAIGVGAERQRGHGGQPPVPAAAAHRSAASAEMIPLVHPFAPRRRALPVRRSMASAEPLELSTPGW